MAEVYYEDNDCYFIICTSEMFESHLVDGVIRHYVRVPNCFRQTGYTPRRRLVEVDNKQDLFVTLFKYDWQIN